MHILKRNKLKGLKEEIFRMIFRRSLMKSKAIEKHDRSLEDVPIHGIQPIPNLFPSNKKVIFLL